MDRIRGRDGAQVSAQAAIMARVERKCYGCRMDPIAELLRDLNDRGKPSMAWVVKWGEHSDDPVAAAWQECRDWTYMDGLFCFAYGLDHEKTVNAFEAGSNGLNKQGIITHWMTEDELHASKIAGADAIRKLGVKPPTIAELLAARASGASSVAG